MRTICTITIAVVLLSLSPLLAASNASLVGVPRPNAPAATPGTVSEGFLATAVLAGGTDPEGVVPCFNCVSGPDIQTLLIALPLGAVYSAQPITVVITGDDLFYGGNASFTYSIKANATVAPVLTGSVSGTVSPGIWFAQFPIDAPAPGMYLLVGDIATGQNLQQHTTVSTHIIVGAAKP
jgi:hypothetical protein